MPPGTANNTNYPGSLDARGRAHLRARVPEKEFDEVTEFRGQSESATPIFVYCVPKPIRVVVGGAKAGALEVDKAPAPLDFLRAMPQDWDGEGAPRPNEGAIQRAEAILSRARAGNVHVADVDADVLGGVVIRLAGASSDMKAWISFMNSGTDTLILSRLGDVSHLPWDQNAYPVLEAFLRGTG